MISIRRIAICSFVVSIEVDDGEGGGSKAYLVETSLTSLFAHPCLKNAGCVTTFVIAAIFVELLVTATKHAILPSTSATYASPPSIKILDSIKAFSVVSVNGSEVAANAQHRSATPEISEEEVVALRKVCR